MTMNEIGHWLIEPRYHISFLGLVAIILMTRWVGRIFK